MSNQLFGSMYLDSLGVANKRSEVQPWKPKICVFVFVVFFFKDIMSSKHVDDL